MINPAMMTFLLKGKLDEILQGEAPEGLRIKEKTDKKIVLAPASEASMEGVVVNSLFVSITYRNTEIILESLI